MNPIDKATFLKFFNESGYVFDFSTNDFNIFTMSSVGEGLCTKYGASKGSSLTMFVNEATDSIDIKLFDDLIQYNEAHLLNNSYINTQEKNKDSVQ